MHSRKKKHQFSLGCYLTSGRGLEGNLFQGCRQTSVSPKTYFPISWKFIIKRSLLSHLLKGKGNLWVFISAQLPGKVTGSRESGIGWEGKCMKHRKREKRNQHPFWRVFLEGEKKTWEKPVAHTSRLCPRDTTCNLVAAHTQDDGWASVLLKVFSGLTLGAQLSLLMGRPEVPRN